MKKNVASQVIGAQMLSATDGSNFTSAVICYVTGDGGTQAAGSVSSGACTHKGKGFHTYTPAQAETNYDHIAFTFEGTGALTATVQVYTSFPQTGDNFARLGAPAGASVSADIAAVKTQTAAIETDTQDIQGRLPASLVSGRMSSDVVAISGDTVAADNAEAFFDGTGYAGTGNTIPNVTTVTNLTNAPTAGDLTATMKASVTTAATAATPVAASVTGAVGSVTGNVGGNVAGSVGSVTGAVGSVTGNVGGNVVGTVASVVGAVGSVTGNVGGNVTGSVGSVAAGGIDAAALDADVQPVIAASVWDALIASYNDADSFGEFVQAITGGGGGGTDWTADERTAMRAILGIPGSGTTPADPTTGILDAIRDAIAALPQDKNGYRLSATGVDDVWDEAIAGHLAAGSVGASLNGATAAGNPWEAVIEGSLTAEDILRVLAAVAAGKTTIVAGSGGTATVTFRDITDSSTIVEAQMDGSERQSVAVTP